MTATATIQHPKYQINVNTLEHLAAPTLELNAIGVAEMLVDRDLVFEPYAVPGRAPNKAQDYADFMTAASSAKSSGLTR